MCQTQIAPRTDNATVNVPSDTDSDTDYEDNNNFDSAYVDIHSQPPIPYEIHVHQAVSQPSPQPGEGYAYQFQCANTNTQLDCITVLDTVNHPLPRWQLGCPIMHNMMPMPIDQTLLNPVDRVHHQKPAQFLVPSPTAIISFPQNPLIHVPNN